MDFRLTPDRDDLMSAIDKLAERFQMKPTEFHGLALVGHELEKELVEGEYFDIAHVPELGPISAALAVERLARLPCTAEIALSMLVRPRLPGEWPRPLALIENGRPGRFVGSAKTLLIADGDAMAIMRPEAQDVEAVDSLFAYPMGRFKAAGQLNAGAKSAQLSSVQAENLCNANTVLLSAAEADSIRKWLRIALAAETAGLLHAAIASTVEHLTERKQFGRPLGTFQALRHRMAECAVMASGVRWLALKAAGTADDADAALAAMHAQESATRVVYDVHQMLGAMGMTLEHPLHLWTYRLKALLSELGGRGGQAIAVGRLCFGAVC